MAPDVHVQGRDHESTAPPSISVPAPRARPDDPGGRRPEPPGCATQRDSGAGVLLLRPRPDLAVGPPAQLDVTVEADMPPTLWCVDRWITRGTEAFLALIRPTPGLIARGRVDRGSFLAPRWDRIGTVGQHVTVAWTEVLDPGDRFPLDEVGPDLGPRLEFDGPGAAVTLPPALGSQVDGVWERWFAHHHRAHRPPGWARAAARVHSPVRAPGHQPIRSSGAGWWWHPLMVG